jgi:NitT/TauT family transport system substrate-binding protein
VAGLAHYAAIEDGFYARHGVDVTSEAMGSEPLLIASIQSGDAAVATLSQDTVITASLVGGNFVILAAQLHGLAQGIVAQPNIHSAAELQGKRVGVSSVTAPAAIALRFYLATQKVELQRDVTLLATGGVPQSRAALETGALEAIGIPQPTGYALARAGFTELDDSSTQDIKYTQGVLATTRRYLDEHPDAVRRMLAGYTEAMRAMLQDKAAAERVLGKWVGVDDPEDLHRTYEIIRRRYPLGPAVDPESVQTSIDLIAEDKPEAGSLRASQLVDNTLVNEAAARWGFPTR